MTYVTRRFENFRKNGMRGFAQAQPAVLRVLLFVPCLAEYLVFSVLCIVGLAAIVFLMVLAWVLGLDNQPETRIR